jgi:carbamoyltransferase
VFLAGIIGAPRALLEDAPWHLQHRFGRQDEHRWEFHWLPHHLCHAASAFYPSPFDVAAVMTVDGYGGDATTAYYRGAGFDLEPLGQVELPHSLGLLYELATNYLGFLGSSDEYKVMAMAALGRPTFAPIFRDLVERGEGGDYRVRGPLVLGERLGPHRKPGAPLEQRHFDVAASLQAVLEERVIDIASWLRERSDANSLCLAGGVALNGVLNGHLRRSGLFRNVWVPPAAGDAGTAVGAALLVAAREDGAASRVAARHDARLGPGFSDEEIEAFLIAARLPFRRMTDVPSTIARLLADQRVVGWFQGRMEFGARALGGRSLLASPADPAMRDRLNHIKGREDFRPVAPLVPAEDAADWFETSGPSPFMTFVERARPAVRNRIAGALHSDGTARLQTVEEAQEPLLHALLRAHQKLTGLPILINTSLNVRQEPIVHSIGEAVAVFATSGIDALALGPFLLAKSEGDLRVG